MGISRQEALDCFNSDDLIGIGMEADAIRRRLHPEGVVSYTIDGRINYNAPIESIRRRIEQTLEIGGTAITLQGEVTPDHSIAWFEDLFRTLKTLHPNLHLHSLSASEVIAIATLSCLSLADTLTRLQASGLDSIPGDDAGILDEAVQNQNNRCTPNDWLTVHRTAHSLGIHTTATMTFGSGEAMEHRMNHLEAIHRLQEETGGFAAFTPWSFQQQSSTMRGFEEATAVEYLKTLAISRMALENIENIQSLPTQGLKVLQMGLRFGGNDVGSASLEETATEEQLRQVIRDAGFKPVQRDTLYRTMFLN
jgi:cyclic dehypoxanthinyl futalosine synthase